MNYIDLFDNGGESLFNNNPMPKKKFEFLSNKISPTLLGSILSFIEARNKRKKNEEMLTNAFKAFSNVDMLNDNDLRDFKNSRIGNTNLRNTSDN